MSLLHHIRHILQSADRWLTHYVRLADDSLETVLNKKIWWILNLSAIGIVLLASTIIGFHSGPYIVALNVLFILSNVVPLTLFHFYKKKIENYAYFTQISMVVLTSAKVYFMGGMLAVGTPLYIGLLGPVYAMTFPNKKRAIFVFILYTASMIGVTLLNPYASEDMIFVYYFLGFLVSVFFIFFTLYYFSLRLEQTKQAEKQKLQELDELKTKFYTHIAHEFRTPLTIIRGMVDQMKAHPETWLDEGHELVQQNTQKLLTLTNQLLDLSKLEARSMPIDLIQDDMSLYLRYLTESFHSLAEAKNITLHFTSEPEEIVMDFDPDKIREIITNILSNAIKFTPQGGEVRIQVKREQEQQLCVHIKDNGIGIPKAQQHRIFDRYFQAGNHLNSHEEGTGLGLALTKELVVLLHGTISITSEVDMGTECILHLPITNQAKEVTLPSFNAYHKQEPATTPENKETVSEEHPLTLLLVEDNPDIIRYLKSLLHHRYHLVTAANGREGLAKARGLIPDLIISDVMMPTMNGFTLCRHLKKDLRTSHIPIILLTARFDTESRMEGLQSGADVFLAKPFNREELFLRIAKLIELRRKLQQRYKSLVKTLDSASATSNNTEDRFLKEVRTALEAHLDDEAFGIEALGKTLGMSRAQLYRKFAALTNTTLNRFLRSIRLNKAKTLLETTSLNVSEVAYQTGFKSPSHFSRVFSKEFGHTPSEVNH